MLIAISVAAAALVFADRLASAQEESVDIDALVRISAQRLEDGNVRFGLRALDVSGEWAEPVTPRAHQFNPANVDAGRWLASSSLLLEVDELGRGRLIRSELAETQPLSSGQTELRIRAQLRQDRRIEFALQQRTSDGWSENVLPRARTMPAFGGATDWLSSTPVAVRVSVTQIQKIDRPEPVTEPEVDPITPVLRSGWRTASLEYAAELGQAAQLHSIVTVHSEQGMRLQVGCFGDVRRVQLVGDSLGEVSTLRLMIDGAPFAAGWSETSKGGTKVLGAIDAERIIETLQPARSLSFTFGSSQPSAITFDIAGVFETPIQTNIDHCGNYTEPAWQPIAGVQSGVTDDVASYRVDWNNSRRYTHAIVEASGGAIGPDGRPAHLLIYCDRQGRKFQLGNLPTTDVQYAVRGHIDGSEERVSTWRTNTTTSGWTYARFESDYERLRNGVTLEVELPFSPIIRMSFSLSALFSTPVQANIDNCGNELWPQIATYVPIVNADGQTSSNISYRSTWFADGAISTNVKSAATSDPAPAKAAYLAISCDSRSGLSAYIEILQRGELESIQGRQAEVTLVIGDHAAETSLWNVRVYEGRARFAFPDADRLAARLRDASVATVEIPASGISPFAFDLGGMFDTPVQGNLDECGYYKMGETRWLRPDVATCANDDNPIAIEPTGWMAKATTLVADAYRRAAGVWPGFEPTEHPVVLAHRASGQISELLTIGVAAPEKLGEAVRLSTAETPFCSLAWVNAPNEQTLSVLNEISNFSFQVAVGSQVSGLYVMIVDLGDRTFNPFADQVRGWRDFVMHEFFHHYQDLAFAFRFGQDFKGYSYDAGNLELAALEDRALRAAAVARNEEARIRAARHFVAIRLSRSEWAPSVAHDEHQEWNEGTARYLERGLGLGYESNGSSALVTDPRVLLRGSRHGHGVRDYYAFSRHYDTGAVILHLLDQLGAENITLRIEAGASPAEVLADHLSVSPEDIEELLAQARTAYDPDGELPDLAVRLAAAAAKEDWDGPGG